MSKDNCPSCQSELSGGGNFRQWCAACNWNLGEDELDLQHGVLGRWYWRMHQQRGAALYDKIVRLQSLSHEMTVEFQRRGLMILCTAINLSVAGLAVAGVIAMVFLHNVFGILFGLLLLGLAYVQRPRHSTMPANVYSREDLPHLFRLADDVAQAIGSPPVAAIALTADYNASAANVGREKRQLLTLGCRCFTCYARRHVWH
jgi:hypothetical protein